MAVDAPNTATRSRRAVLAAGLGGLAAAVASALGRPTSVRAVDGNPLVLGSDNFASGLTTLEKTTADFSGNAFAAYGFGSGIGVIGNSSSGDGVRGNSTTGNGVFGTTNSASGRGVTGHNLMGIAVLAEGAASGYAACYGKSNLGYGVIGDTHVDTTGGTGTAGLWGRDYASSLGVGTYGTTEHGVGVFGRVASGVNGAVPAPPAGNIGVLGDSPSGTGVLAKSSSGTALQASGKVHFSRSGKTKILAGHGSKSISLAGVTSSSMIWAVLASNRSGRWVRAIVPASGSFTVYLNTTVTSDSQIAWFVLD